MVKFSEISNRGERLFDVITNCFEGGEMNARKDIFVNERTLILNQCWLQIEIKHFKFKVCSSEPHKYHDSSSLDFLQPLKSF